MTSPELTTSGEGREQTREQLTVGLAFLALLAQGLHADIAAQYALGPGWFIPTLAVPAFTVAHLLVVRLLLTRGSAYAAARPPTGVAAQLKG